MAAEPYINHMVIADNSGWELKLHFVSESDEMLFRYSIEGFAGPAKGRVYESPLRFVSYQTALKQGMERISVEDRCV